MAKPDAGTPSSPTPARPLLTWREALLLLCGLSMVVALYMIFIWVPTERNLGISQRIFYFHVPIAWVGFLAFGVIFAGSVGYLWRRSQRWDALAYSAAEIGVVFTSLMLVTGIIWAKPVWNVWWTWEPRLTTSLVLWLINVAYLMLRAYAPLGERGARHAAVLGIIGALDVPIVYLSIVWWRTIAHPEMMIGPARAPDTDLAGSMVLTLMVSLLAMTLFFAYLLAERYALRRAEDDLDTAHIYYQHQRALKGLK